MNNENINNNLPCEIVKDLLPLYHDDVVSDVTKDAVKFHLDSCTNCANEYESLREALPYNKDENSSKIKYNKMTKKLKLKKIIWGIMIFAATLTTIGIIAYLLLMIPVISADNENIEVISAYKYEDEGEDKFLLIYSIPHYSTPSYWNPKITYENNTAIIDIELKHTIITPYEKEANEYPWAFDHVFVLDKECSTIKLGDEIIWSDDKDGDTNIPGYVWEFDNEAVNSMSNTDNYSMFSFRYNDGHIVYWDLEGNIIYDEYPDENGNYPTFPTE